MGAFLARCLADCPGVALQVAAAMWAWYAAGPSGCRSTAFTVSSAIAAAVVTGSSTTAISPGVPRSLLWNGRRNARCSFAVVVNIGP